MDELQHFGVPGMKWGQRKVQALTGGGSPGPALPHLSAAVHGLRKDAGFVATRETLRHYGHLAVPIGKAIGKGGIKLVKYTPRAAKGAGVALKLLGGGAKVIGKGGKAYVKGAIAITKAIA